MKGEPLAFTTSWDDGHPLDLRLAETLCRHGVRGTFYVPLRNAEREVMPPADILVLRDMGFEIGGHTLSHVRLTRVPFETARREVTESKVILEDLLQAEVTSFCYPGGRYSARLARLMAASGYRLARTTAEYDTRFGFDSFLMPTTLHVYPHSPLVRLRHALKEANFRGLRGLVRAGAGRSGADLLRALRMNAEFVHLWGHSWELEEAGLWKDLATLLEIVRDSGPVSFVDNATLGRLNVDRRSSASGVSALLPGSRS